MEENPELTELLLVEFPQTGKFFNSNAVYEVGSYMDMIADILRQGISDGIFRENMDVNIVATLVYGGIHVTVTRWILEDRRYSLRKVADDITEVLLSGIRA